MDGVWVQAFLARTRLLDPDFLGSLLSTISKPSLAVAYPIESELTMPIAMCSSSLRNGTPLPQITAAPLIDLLTKHSMGFNITANEEDYGLPRIITPAVLANEQYMYVDS